MYAGLRVTYAINSSLFDYCIEFRFNILQQFIRNSVYCLIALNNTTFTNGFYFFRLFGCFLDYGQLLSILYTFDTGVCVQRLMTKARSDLQFYKRPTQIVPIDSRAAFRKAYNATLLNSTFSLRKKQRIINNILTTYGMSVEEYERTVEEAEATRFKLLNETIYDKVLNVTPESVMVFLIDMLTMCEDTFTTTF